MTDVIDTLYQRAAVQRSEAESKAYKELWDRRYEGIKTGGIVYLMEYMDRSESKEAFRQLFSRLVIDIAALQKKPE